MNEAARLQNYYASIPATKYNYELIHYDLEYDNVFYDEVTGACNVIVFKDAMYHWYAMDIKQVVCKIIYSLKLLNTKNNAFWTGIVMHLLTQRIVHV